MEILSVKDVSFTYPNADIPALDGVSFSLGSGELAVLCGPSGCGKSTLLRNLKPAISPHGTGSGEIFFEGRRAGELGEKEACGAIGFVGQSPENQIVTDKVWHELAFGLESLGFDNVSIRRRIAETASFFGIESWFDKSTAKLSGGQKQLLCLASVMVMRPRLLLLDEPVSQLDPIMAEEFLSAVVRINRELGTTVLLSEHRLEEILPVSDRLIVMERGRIAVNDTPKSAGMYLRESEGGMFASMPAPMRIWAAVPDSGDKCPITVGEGKSWLESYADTHTLSALPSAEKRSFGGGPALEVKDVWFRYEKNSPDILKGISFCLHPGEMLALLGANGSGKSTLLSLLSGANRPYRGRIIKADNGGTVGMLPQEPLALFTEKTVWEELNSTGKGKLPKGECESRARRLLSLCGLSGTEGRHPYDLSGGERQRAALAKILMLRPSILLLDEPTKGMDAAFKRCFAAILGRLLEGGTAIILVSHDVEFCAEYADRCALLFDGTAISESDTRAFFSDNCFYTTSAGRMARGVLPGAVTANDVISACGGDTSGQDNLPPEYYGDGGSGGAEPEFVTEPPKDSSRMSLFQKISAAAGAVLCAAAIICALTFEKDVFVSGGQPWISYLLIAAAVPFFAAAFARLSRRPSPSEQGAARGRRKKLPRHTVCAAAALLLAVPLTLYVGVACLGDEKYLFISLLILLEAMLPFFLIFEERKPRARELVLVAVLCAFGFAGRGIFFMLPQFKPVIALTVIAGAAFGGETGFLVGAVTMLTSNIMFQEGVFTPWQMFAMGMAGFLAGVIYNTGFFAKSRFSLCFFGFFASLGYGAVMNFAFALTSHAPMTLSALLPFFAMGLPMDIVHAVSTVIFLFFLSEPMLEKLGRVKVKYGLIM